VGEIRSRRLATVPEQLYAELTAEVADLAEAVARVALHVKINAVIAGAAEVERTAEAPSDRSPGRSAKARKFAGSAGKFSFGSRRLSWAWHSRRRIRGRRNRNARTPPTAGAPDRDCDHRRRRHARSGTRSSCRADHPTLDGHECGSSRL